MDEKEIQKILNNHEERIQKLEQSFKKNKPAELPSTDNKAEPLSSRDIHQIKTCIEALDSPTAAVVGLCVARKFEEKNWPSFNTDDFIQVYKQIVRTSSKIPVTGDYISLVKDLRSKYLWIENVGRGRYRLSDVGAQEYMRRFKND